MKHKDKFDIKMKNDHCCSVMNGYASEKNPQIDYDAPGRFYCFHLKNSPHGTHQQMNYCFWCGAKLPEDLGNEWAQILKEEYDLENPFKDWDRVPNEFKTDEWWKKRGL